MAWVESASGSFRARHDSAAAGDARQLLLGLERERERLGRMFPRLPDELTIVLHDGPGRLALASPLWRVQWLATNPAARRYVVGWVGGDEIHMLSPAQLAQRASNVPGSRQMLDRSAACLYALRVIIACNPDLARVMPALRLRRGLRWAWLLEGAARWFGGQTDHARPAIARRLRESGPPSFPPSAADAPLLGGTVIDLLARESDPRGTRAAVRLACRLHPQGPVAALTQAFGGRPVRQIEDAWRSHLARWAPAQ